MKRYITDTMKIQKKKKSYSMNNYRPTNWTTQKMKKFLETYRLQRLSQAELDNLN